MSTVTTQPAAPLELATEALANLRKAVAEIVVIFRLGDEDAAWPEAVHRELDLAADHLLTAPDWAAEVIRNARLVSEGHDLATLADWFDGDAEARESIEIDRKTMEAAEAEIERRRFA